MTKSHQPDLATALQQYMVVQLHVVEEEQARVIAGTDPEALHRFRVALRRSRALLSEFKALLSPQLEAFRSQLAEVARVTNECRDVDVFLDALANDRDLLPVFLLSGLDTLEGHLEVRRRIAHREVVNFLHSAHYRSLLTSWRTWLEGPASRLLTREQVPLAKALRKNIRRRYRKVTSQLAGLSKDTEVEEIHRFRIACKKLRYVLEFAVSQAGGKRAKAAIRVLKELQTSLGDHHDANIQSQWLHDYLMEQEPDKWTSASVGWLSFLFEERQRQAWRKLLKQRKKLLGLQL